MLYENLDGTGRRFETNTSLLIQGGDISSEQRDGSSRGESFSTTPTLILTLTPTPNPDPNPNPDPDRDPSLTSKESETRTAGCDKLIRKKGVLLHVRR